MLRFQQESFKQLQYFEKKLPISLSHTLKDLHTFGKIKLYFQKQPFADSLQNRCLKNLAIFTGKHLCWHLLSMTLQAFSPATLLKGLQVFSCEYCEIFKNSFFHRAPLVTASVLWTITMLNFNRILGNLCTMKNFNFTYYFNYRVMGCSMEGVSYWCFRKAISNNFFQQVLMINTLSAYANLLQHFIFACFLLIEDHGKCALRKDLVIGCSFKHIFF